MTFLHAIEGGIELDVLVQPRASRTRLGKPHDDRIKVQLAAPPVDGAANDALVEYFAELFSVPKRQVELVSGQTSRRKRVRVRGVAVAVARLVVSGI